MRKKRRTEYRTNEEASRDGWTKNIPTDWTKRDTSGPRNFGYEFTATGPNGQEAKTTELWFTNERSRSGSQGCFAVRFHEDDFK